MLNNKNTISQKVRNETVNAVLLAAIIIFFPTLVVSIARSQFTGWIYFYWIQIGVFTSISAAYIFRKKIGLMTKVAAIQIAIFLIATVGLHEFGYFASAKLFFILIPIFFWFFIERRAAIIATIICSAVYILYGYLYTNDIIRYPSFMIDYYNRGATWLTYGFVMLSITIFCIVIFSRLAKEQNDSFKLVKENEAQLRFLTDNVKDVIWIFDIETNKFTYVSNSIENIQGFSAQDFLSLPMEEYMPESSRTKISSIIQERLEAFKKDQGIKYFTYEIEVFHKKGNTLWMEVNSHYRINPQTQKIEVIGTSRDVTDRKNAQIALEKSEELYKLATGASNLGIWEWYTDSDEVYFSNLYESQIGYLPNELEGKFSTWVDHLHPDERDEKVEKVQRYLDNPVGRFILEFRFRHKEGYYIWIHSRAEITLNENGKVKRMYGTHLDITKQKRNEEILLDKNAMLEKINAELDNFVYRISHDIRAPLSSCFGLLNLMEKEQVINVKNSPYITLFRDVLTKQDSVIKSILDYSRNSRGDLHVEEINLSEMITTTFNELKYMNDSSGKVVLLLDIPQDYKIHSDKNRIQFLLNNLISNAIKYADYNKSAPHLKVEAKENGKSHILTFSDNGIGIPAEVLPHVFEMFYRGHHKSTGSGLGLYIVKETVSKLNGAIQVSSVFTEHTQIVITLPDVESIGKS